MGDNETHEPSATGVRTRQMDVARQAALALELAEQNADVQKQIQETLALVSSQIDAMMAVAHGTHPIEPSQAVSEVPPLESEGDGKEKTTINFQRPQLQRPPDFCGNEPQPYAFLQWWDKALRWARRVSNGVDAGATDWVKQLLLPPAQDLVLWHEREQGHEVTAPEELYEILRRNYQKRDPGPMALADFRAARQKETESPVEYLNRLRLLTFVINESKDPRCSRITDERLAEKLMTTLHEALKHQLLDHQEMLTSVGGIPDVSADGIATEAQRLSQAHKLKQSSKGIRAMSAVSRPDPRNSSAASQQGRRRKYFLNLDASTRLKVEATQVQLAKERTNVDDPVSEAQKRLCHANGLCERCHRYGHDRKECRGKQVFVPKPKN
jgi:hypothetical protein